MPKQETTYEELEARVAEAEALIESLRSQGVDELEERVEARTIQLAAVNRELQREIGEHLKTQERIRLLSSAVEQSSEGTAVADPDGNLLFVNEAFARIHGYEQDELAGKHLRVFHTDEQMPAVERANRVLRDTGEFNGEIWHVRRDGQVFPTLMQNSLLRDETGTPIGMIGTLRDVTEMKRIEEALRVKDFAIGSSINALAMADRQGNLTYVNDAFLRLWGYETQQELLGKHATSFWEHQQQAAQIIEHIHVHGTWLGEMTGRKKSGDLIELSLAANMIRNAGGEPIGMMGSFVDVTEQRQQHERTQVSLAILQHLNFGGDRRGLIDGILRRVKDYTGFDAVGIRLREGGDFPYYATSGFPDHFVDKERYLCVRDETGNSVRDSEGNPVLECMCDNVLCGRIDPSRPFFTDGGSFWTNSTTELLTSVTDDQLLARPRRRCHDEGYESVALIPLRSNGETIGLLQLNDHRPGRLDIELIPFLERLGHSIGIALHRADATEALEASEARYKSLVENSLVGVNIFQDGRIVFANHSMAESLGYSVSELCSLTPDQIRGVIHPEDREKVLALAQARLAGESVPSRYVFRVVRKDGSVAWLENAVSLTTFDGRPASQGFSLDITERKRIEDALHETEQRYREIVDNAQDAIFTVALDGTILFLNPAWEAITGLPRAEWMGRSFAPLVHPDDLSLTMERFESALKGESPSPYEVRFKTGSDEYKTGQFVIAPRFKDGEVVAVVGIGRDITERKRAQEQLREREKELAHLGRLSTMGEMAAGIAHELKQPLSAITNYATGSTWHLQNATADPQELTDVMEKITAQARHASDIIDRLRSSVRKCEPCRSSTDINQLLTDVLKLVEHELRQESVSVHLDLQDKLPLVFADAIQIQQVALNLIRNATDAMRGNSWKERHMTLAASVADGDTVEVSVCDTGTGLSEEVRRKIFDAYFTTKAEGLGMGLAISRTIVEAHGGRIWATPNSPHGTVFRFVIPTVPKAD